jgi:3-isopropylmalate/(R)-2-methylmalate dehydratase large subunit
MAGSSLFEKIWSSHVVNELGDGFALLHVDRHILHDLNAMKSLVELRERGYGVRNPELTVATPDHGVSTLPGRTIETNKDGAKLLRGYLEETKRAGIRAFDMNEDGQGIVHVIGPELGLTQPGCLILCGDSHTCTHGGLAALGFGAGRSEVIHVLATQTIYQKKPKQMRINFNGTPGHGVTPKDLILHLIGRVGADGGNGYAVEYAGSAIRAMSVEGRLTICNLSIEFGAKVGMIGPDDTAYEYLHGRRFAPKAAEWDAALAYWRSLPTDADASFDRELDIDVSTVAPQITWGTSPQHVIAVDEVVPDPKTVGEFGALAYMGLSAGQRIAGTPIDAVFIGSCTNSRLSDLREASAIVKGRKVKDGVQAWVVPGSQQVKRAAEAEGLDTIFLQAGFEWREPGCSMCLAANGETLAAGKRSISTTNRNFEGRQGPGARTHLASPAMAAAAAIEGAIVDVRRMMV